MPLIRTRQDIDDLLEGPTPAKEKLLAACRAGEACQLGNSVPPDGDPDPAVHIRADVLRYLITGGCANHPTADWGVDLYGAHVTGTLDLRLATARGVTGLLICRIDVPIQALQARFELLSLSGSELTTLDAQGAQVTGNVFQRGLTATAEVSLAGATIAGQLDCTGAQFNATDGNALSAQRLTVTQGLFFRNVTTAGGVVTFSSATVGYLVNDPTSWPDGRRLILEGLTYDSIINTAFPQLSDRLDWLARGSTWRGEFFPQPYTLLAKVYRETGHDVDARAVLFELERQRRRHRRYISRVTPNGDWDVAFKSLWHDLKNLVRLVWDHVLRFVVGYGVRPFRSLWSLAALTILAIFLAHMAWEEGSMAPNSAVILTSEDWRAVAARADIENPAAIWSNRHGKGRDYATFNRYAYAADLVIPIINLGQTDAWAPSTNREIWGERLWRYGFFLTVAGWIVTALGAAAITGIIRRD